ncbi:MAG TPA: Rne/Rng family ribonuclease [Pilimelia sp.]|nr:Rne/Rng family ribonuclease [Pilimelia sp.]
MLDNEPMGGESTGAQPGGDTADSPTTRRARVTRRRSAAAAEAPAGDPAEAPDGSAAPAPARRRRRATPPAAEEGLPPATESGAQVPPEGGPAASDAAAAPGGVSGDAAAPAGAASGDAAAAAPATAPKTTRARRRKAVPAASGDAAAEPAQGADPGQPADAGTAPVPAGPVPGSGPDPSAELPPAVPAAEGDQPASRGRRRAPAAVPLFMPPEETAPVVRASRRRSAADAPPAEAAPTEAAPVDGAAAAAPAGDAPAAGGAPDQDEPADAGRRRRRSRRAAEADGASSEPVADDVEAEDDEDDEDDEAGAARRRRRGRRGRGRGKGTADEAEEETAEVDDGDAEDEGLTRRRRRRRRKGTGDAEAGAEDGVHTVVRIREPRRVADEVQGVTGSTRLEAKRQRRRDGREQRRTRPPILSESEFLARREAVDRVMVVRQRGDRVQIAVLEDGVLVEHYVSRASAGTMVGNVYLGKVQNVLPSMEAAFVDVGRGRNAVLYAGEVNWDATGLEGRARSIEQALKSGDSVLVQVTKDPLGHKGARLTSHIALSGRHLVYVPHGNASGISRKLPDTERKRLRDVLKKLVPDGAGVIVRTAAEGASEDELARDVKRLQAQWEDIQAKAADGGAPVLLYEEPDLLIRVVRDLFNEDFRELVVQGDSAYEEVEAYLSHVSPDLVARLRRHAGAADVFAEKRIDEQIIKGLDRKVFLPSGGHLVIDRTEAMTVVDVNTGKYTGVGGNLEETVTRNNLEAAEEIVRQLRLRDLGGIIVIDFIDMVLESNRELVLRRLTECLGRDRTKHQVTEITSLGLVQMTRKRIGAGLLEAFSETCEACKGRGLIVHTEPVAERARTGGAGDKVRAVAAAAAPAKTEAAAGGTGRRRGRRAAAGTAEPEAVEETAPVPADEDDTMGYDLSRYAEEPESAAPVPGLIDGDEFDPVADDEEEPNGLPVSRRRTRRGGARRKTRP